MTLARKPWKPGAYSTIKPSRKPPKRAADPVTPEVYLLVMRRFGGRCAGSEFGPCAGRANWHHRRPVEKGGPSTIQNGLRLCHRHHTWAHGHPEEARVRGWLLRGWQDPAQVPVTLRDGYAVLLHDHGGYAEVSG